MAERLSPPIIRIMTGSGRHYLVVGRVDVLESTDAKAIEEVAKRLAGAFSEVLSDCMDRLPLELARSITTVPVPDRGEVHDG